MNDKVNPQQILAVIREESCIGCTKCIDACPVDAILGSAQLMHTVITSECIGCKLCVAPCPVDCIDLIPVTDDHQRIPPAHIKARNQARQLRLLKNQISDLSMTPEMTKKNYVAEALARAKVRKL